MELFKRILSTLGGVLCLLLVYLLAIGELQKYLEFNSIDKEIGAVFFLIIMGFLLILLGVSKDQK